MAEQGTHKPLVGGSNPPSATTILELARVVAVYHREWYNRADDLAHATLHHPAWYDLARGADPWQFSAQCACFYHARW